ncbi:MAG: HAMP domain-containing histidine kinase [Ruminococcaceae bacterium]|nr:HAMP domain-containing histidine kinase [Oscillospiraceae bacterium]
MKGEGRARFLLRILNRFFTIFLIVAFVITASTMLFVSVLSVTLELTLTGENLGLAAKLTFANTVLLSLLFTAIDLLRHHLTVERPVKKITEAAERMIAGDFTVRIKSSPPGFTDGHFNEIIDCINKVAEELSGVETLRTDFIANVSHEMKTPLAAIRNYGKLLEAPSLPEEERVAHARAIIDATRRLSDMMTNVLKLSRLENQKIYPKAERYDLGEQLCEELLQYETVWEGRGIEIETEIEEGVTVRADRELLSLVWSNLFSNAFKFTERGGKVTLRLFVDGGYAVVRVEDTGCGMSPEVGAHIFEKFYQGDTSHAAAGNGLGLPLVKRVVDILQAEIAVESTVGEGSVFTVRIGRDKNGLQENR